MKRILTSGPENEVISTPVWQEQPPGFNRTLYYTAQVLRSSYYKRTEGVDTPDFHEKKKKGLILPFTPFTQATIRFDCFRDEVKWSNGTYFRYSEETGLWAWADLDPFIIKEDELHVKASSVDATGLVQAAAAKVYSSGWDGLTFVAELTKTAAMFRGVVTRWAGHVRAGTFEKTYLESRYGWRTLMYDMQDINKLLSNINGERTRFRDRVGTTVKFTEHSTLPVGGDVFDGSYTITSDYTIGTRGSIVADIEPPAIAINPITTAWELVRFSFVVDWVVDVGQALEALSFLALSTAYSAAAGYCVQCIRTAEATVTDVKSPFTSGSYYHDSKASGELILRTPSSVSFTPQIKLNLNALKVLDLVALFVQLTRR